MNRIRNAEDILTEEDREFLEEVKEIMLENTDILRDNSNLSVEEVVDTIDSMYTFTAYQTVVRRVNSEVEAVKTLRASVQEKYENAKTKQDKDKYLDEYKKLSSELSKLNEEFKHYYDYLGTLEENAHRCDAVVTAVKERAEARDNGKNNNIDDGPSMPKTENKR